ncbi:MAG: flagellar basal body P-ring formation chaperone FlgA [Rhodoferax sp.]
MQLLCHWLLSTPNVGRRVAARRWTAVLALVLGGLCGAQTPLPPDKLLTEVGQWVQQTQQLDASQFSFAPLDSRVQLQSCERPLVMDTPFAARETVRVRCLGNPSWQLYLRVVLKAGVAPGLAAQGAGGAGSDAALRGGASRKVVVSTQLMRTGSIASRELLREVEMPVPGSESQLIVSLSEAENSEFVREVQPGVPLHTYDLRRAVVIKQGQVVTLTVGQGNGFSITARVEAMQDGKIGEQIRLKNPESGRLLTGTVTGPNAARGL